MGRPTRPLSLGVSLASIRLYVRNKKRMTARSSFFCAIGVCAIGVCPLLSRDYLTIVTYFSKCKRGQTPIALFHFPDVIGFKKFCKVVILLGSLYLLDLGGYGIVVGGSLNIADNA